MTKPTAKERKGKLNKKDRRMLAQYLIITGQLTAGALLFKQTFTGRPFDLSLGFLGGLVLVWLFVWAIAIMKGGDDKNG